MKTIIGVYFKDLKKAKKYATQRKKEYKKDFVILQSPEGFLVVSKKGIDFLVNKSGGSALVKII